MGALREHDRPAHHVTGTVEVGEGLLVQVEGGVVVPVRPRDEGHVAAAQRLALRIVQRLEDVARFQLTSCRPSAAACSTMWQRAACSASNQANGSASRSSVQDAGGTQRGASPCSTVKSPP
ncbi:hypothetical protein OHA55_25365 [Streptomyces sp. NBC_00102]|nr:hypothetical protein [Streptomyces sp. NBC_00102]